MGLDSDIHRILDGAILFSQKTTWKRFLGASDEKERLRALHDRLTIAIDNFKVRKITYIDRLTIKTTQ